MLEKSRRERVKGTAVFLTGSPTAPAALLHNLKHYKVLHEQNIILNVATEDTPRFGDENVSAIERLSDRFCGSPCASASWKSLTFPSHCRRMQEGI